MITKKIIMFVVMMAAAVIFAAPTVTDVTAKQRYPWNGKVDITYTLTGDVTAGFSPEAEIALFVTASNRVDGATYAAAAFALSGDTGTAEGAHHVVWDLNAQGLEFVLDDVVFTVAYYYNHRYAKYCVIDLSAGADASSYPVTYLADVPSGGFSTDEYKTTKLVLRLVEPGTFMMGGTYQVTLTKPFYCGVFEVTQKQWELVTGSNPCSSTFYGKGDGYPVHDVSYDMIRGSSAGAGWPGSSAVDGGSFLGKLQARTGLDLDLPTEAQWEYACRAGTTTTYSYGSSADGNYMWYYGNSSYQSHVVGTKQPNAWGLYDMHGNVWEWCLDWPGSLSSGVTDPVGSSSGSYRVVRGGGWNDGADSCTSSRRVSSYPSHEINDNGFRLVRTLSNTDGERSPAAVAGAERADLLCAAEAAPAAIDSRTGVRESDGNAALTYSSLWDGGDGATVTIAQDGAALVEGLTGEGERAWSVRKTGSYTLSHTTYTNGVAGKVETATFVVPGPELTFEYDGWPFAGGNVTIGGNFDGWTIYYTLDGSTPTTESTEYTGPFTLSAAATVKAFAVSGNGFTTDVFGREYAFAGDARIENVRARQRWPWNGKVDIDCKVYGIYEAIYRVKFAVFAVDLDSGNTNKVSHFWVVRDGVNSNDRVVYTNGEYRLVWDARADLGEAIYSNMVVSVSLVEDVHNGIQLWEGGPYWAETNIGADEPWEYGYYFWWGDAVGYKRENDDWAASDGSGSDFSSWSMAACYKYPDVLQSEGWITAENVIAPVDDAAQVQWGGGWRMPTGQELIDITNKCEWVWTTTNGVNGYVVRGKGDYVSASIFLPAAGRAYGTALEQFGTSGYYWSSVPGPSDYSSWALGFHQVFPYVVNNYLGFRVYGFPIRPVLVKKTKSYMVTYMSGMNGSGMQRTAIKTQGVNMMLKEAIFTRSGYTQTGWSVVDGGAKVYDLGASYTLDASIVLYPFWTVHKKIQLWAEGPYWADTNIGAENPWNFGCYFWWGDTIGYKREYDVWISSDRSFFGFSFQVSTAPTYGKTRDVLQNEGWITADGVLAPGHDAAHVQWGDAWRMPTYSELRDLHNNCDWTWTATNGVNGYVVRGKGDYASNSIFLPCGGFTGGKIGSSGYYWASDPLINETASRHLGFDSDSSYGSDGRARDCGQSIRPVQSFSN